MTQPGPTTRILHGVPQEQVTEQPLSAPLYQAATFAFSDMEHFADVARTKISGGYLYSRWGNPTVDRLAKIVADAEGAEASACFASGMAAIAGALAPMLRAGDHVVSASQLYGGTHGLFNTAFARGGIEVTRVDVTDLGAVAAAFRPETKVLYSETIGNPTLPVADLDALADIAQAHRARLVVDATFTPPTLLRPLEHGVDVSIHSATKYLSGHGDVMAGVASGSQALVDEMRHLMLDTGAVLAPFEAWLCARGMETMPLRVEQACENAMTLARALQEMPGVRSVLYPGLEQHPQHDLAKRLLGDRFGGMLAFEVDSVEAGRTFLQRVRLARPAASLGGTRTLVVHPASVTHTQLTAEERTAVGVSDGLIRMAVGIEDVEDLIEDVEQALA